jgi:hypothetical protein
MRVRNTHTHSTFMSSTTHPPKHHRALFFPPSVATAPTFPLRLHSPLVLTNNQPTNQPTNLQQFFFSLTGSVANLPHSSITR